MINISQLTSVLLLQGSTPVCYAVDYLRVFLFFFFPHKGKEEKEEAADDMLADLGKPRLGEYTRITCHIRESMEFKVSCSQSKNSR